MTLLELQNTLGNQLQILVDTSLSEDRRIKEIEISKSIVALAKQMINNADVILRSDKLLHEFNNEDTNISKII